ncbi:hypothetical protein HD597_011280 [Nonomuraea thailandensis]|uniref:Uncharacterized protein n=1 Tax=Nonomuraea thailandensis TaxID=1188745 RepID=A0A9X2GUL1_9ACTN|nr:hypothetical protein [Nonomuraea thailandensis]MCP2364260.1 hypothetical protein [Nonomuraea thailandensis]
MIPAPSELRPCNDCGQPVLWTTTAAGKRLAVDAHPAEDGNQACYRVVSRSWVSRSLDGADARPLARWEDRYRPHVATCTGRPAVQEQLPGMIPKGMPSNVVRLEPRQRSRAGRRRRRR